MTKFVPDIFPGIGGCEYEKVWKENQEFCKFALKVENPTGFMKDFRDFCRKKLKDGNDKTGGTIGSDRSCKGDRPTGNSSS